MKILHIDMGKEWRGGQRQCLLLHEGLLEKGIDSHLLCREGGEFAKRNVQNSRTAKFRGEISPTSYRSLKKVINEIKPDIVQSHDASSLTPLVLMRLFGAKFVLINTRRVDFSVRKNLTSLYKYKNRYVNIVAISEGVKKVLLNDGIDAKQIKVIYDGVPEPERPSAETIAKLKEEFGLTGIYPILGTVANFAPHKDYYTLLAAYRLYANDYPGSRLLLAGAGPLFEDIKAECSRLKLDKQVIFTGFRTDVTAVADCIDIYVVSSYLEGLNTSIIDAMFLGKPVVGTDTGGIPELVKDGVTGYLAPPRSPEKLAGQLIRLTGEPDNIRKFGQAGLKHARNFTSGLMVDRYIKYYKELLK